MALAFNCPECGSELLVRYLKVGEKAKCNSCGATFVVPENAKTVDEVRRWPDQRLPSQKLREDNYMIPGAGASRNQDQRLPSQKLREDSQLDVSTSRTPLFAIVGLLIGGFIGFLCRPEIPLFGKLPLQVVLAAVSTFGSNSQGIDQMLVPYAQTSFLYLLLGSFVGLVIGIKVGRYVNKSATSIENIKDTISRLATTATPSKLSTSDPKNITLGQSIEEVEGILGKPDKKIELGTKVTYIYTDIKIVFVDGKVSDAQ